MGFSAPRGRNAVSGWRLPEKGRGLGSHRCDGTRRRLCGRDSPPHTPHIVWGNLRQWLYDEGQARQFLEEAKERVLLKRKKMEGETL